MKSLAAMCLALLTICGTVNAQRKEIICCAPTPTEKFALNAVDKAFILSHPNPKPFKYKSARGHDITFKTSDGTDGHGWEVKTKDETGYYMFIFHEWWGLNDYIKQESERISNDLGINVIAIDLYDNKVAATREDAAKYTQDVKTARATAIIKGAYDYVGNSAKIFTLGWCFGGGWSLQAALEGGKQVVGCIMYYGQPENDVDKLRTLNCDILGFFGTKDKWLTPKVVDEFRANLNKAGIRNSIYEYDADHAFANPSNPVYDKAATEDAYDKMLTFVKLRIR
ncbi:MAG TPA: dienelactone hydrolase family protein [Chitinophagaceae bacterium]|nr:dienelactone hydrolase family protein [Chitinophagaceae bacterium]